MRHAKASLIASIAIGLLAISTAGVSTFAWFQSNASATVTAESDDVEITVSKPDDISVSNTQIFMYRGNPTGTNVSSYTQVASVGARTITDFYPGEFLTIAIAVSAANSKNITTGSMDLTYRAFSHQNRVIQGNTSYLVNISSAISVKTGANGTGDYPSMTEIVEPASRDGIAKSSMTAAGSGLYYKQTKVTDAISGESIGANTGYFFYTIEFKNTTDTFYQETDSSGEEVKTTPENDNDTRFFKVGASGTGSSIAYEGLDFNITLAEITIG